MPRSGKNNERTEQVPRGRKKPTKIEPLHPQAGHPDKLYNDLAKFPSENPYPVMRIHKDGTVMYANKASEPLLKARSSGVGQPAPAQWRRLVKEILVSGCVAREEVKDNGRVFAFRAVPIAENNYVNFYGVDITGQKKAEEERELMIKLLSLINSDNQMHELMKLVTVFLKDWSACEAVGIRLQDGEDFPYFVTSGFPEEFVQAESKLCSLNELGEPVRDSEGRVYLECMCGNIISGRFDPSKPFFTEHGSFWTNSTTDLLAGTTKADRLAKTRNRCNTAGYESVALIPLRTGKETFGLLQFNSKQRGCFTPEKISLFERLADNLAIGLAQRKAEESLRESEKRLRDITFSMADWVWEVDENGVYTYSSQKGSDILGRSCEDIIGKTPFDFMPPDEAKRVAAIFSEIAANKAPIKDLENWNIRKNGERICLLTNGVPILDEDGNLKGYRGVDKNITERKHAEETLRESEGLLRGLFENMTSGAAIYKVINDGSKGSDYIIRDFNAAGLRIEGKRKDEVIGKSLFDLRPNIDQYGLIPVFQKVWRTGKPGYFPSTIYVDEKYSNWYENRVFKLPTGEIVAIYDDVTERKRAEELLRRNEERLKAALDAAELGTWDWNLVNGQITWVGHHEQLFGFKEGEFDGRYETFEKRIHPDDIAELNAAVEKAKKEKSEYFCEYRVIWPDGTVRWISGKGRCHYDQTGRAVRMLGTVQDITERNILEETLEKERKELVLITDSLPIIAFYKDKEGRFVRVNKTFAEALNTPREKFLGKTVFDFYSAKIAQSMTNDDHEVFRSGRAKLNIVEQYESVRGLRWAQTDKVPIFDKNGILVGLVGFAQDVTERRLAEERLQEERNLLRTVIDHIPDKVYVKDKNSRFVTCNKATLDGEYLKSETEIIGKTDFDLYDRKTAQQLFDNEQELMRTGKPGINLECQRIDKTGNFLSALQTKVPLSDSHGNIVGIVGINRDITERMRVEHKILEYQKHLKQLTSRLTLTEERERRRIAGKIHDEISQTLAMAKIKLDTLRNSPPSEASAAEIEEISSSVENVIQKTRTLTFELSNPILYELGFEVAVAEWLSEQVQVKHGIATEFQDDGKSKPLDNDMRILLFRNVRELLINCIKHANAGRVRVNIRRIDDSIEVAVEDNGVGFDPAEVRSTAGRKSKFGLFSIRESLESLGGHFIIESKPGAGCKAIMTAPFKDQSHKKEV